MRLKDTGLTSQDIKDKVNKYMIETYERFTLCERGAKDMYMYDENGEEYLISMQESQITQEAVMKRL